MIFWLDLLSAVALLLWGLRLVRTGVMRAFGPVLRKSARSMEGQRLRPFTIGCVTAVLLQSSAATAMIVAGFSGQSVIGVTTAFIAILGADLGTALAAIVVSQNLPFASPILLIVGVFGFLSSEDAKRRSVSRALLGLGLILLALSMIRGVSSDLSGEADFLRVLAVLSDFPIVLLAIGVGLSYLAHSSLAVVLFAASLSTTGLITVPAALAFVLGANIGSGLLPFLANLKSRKGARVPVTANLIVRVVLSLAAFLALPWVLWTGWLEEMPFIPVALTAHLALNVAVGLVGIVIAGPLLRYLDSTTEEDQPDPLYIEPVHLDEKLLSRPAEALASAKREALVMAELARRMVQDVLPLFREPGGSVQDEIEAMEDSLDRLFNAIKAYLTDILQSPLKERETRKAMDLLTFVTNMEHVGDIVDRNLLGLSAKKQALHVNFSDAGLAEIDRVHTAILENFDLAIRVFLSDEADLARQLYEAKAEIRRMERKSVATHIERLGTGNEDSLQSSELHLDVLRDLARINSHLTSTAYPVLIGSGEVLKTKWKRKRAS